MSISPKKVCDPLRDSFDDDGDDQKVAHFFFEMGGDGGVGGKAKREGGTGHATTQR